MSKVAHYLQEHLLGEVTASPEVRRYFAQDSSILNLAPAVVVYPRNENDIRKTVRFAWQLAERGRPIPITARGGGSNTSGAALGSGIMMVFTAHMNRILTLNVSKRFMVVEPGIGYDKLEQTLYTHGLFLPPYPSAHHSATIGGGVAAGMIGEKSIKYGSIADYVKRLRVVLSNGEVIETGPLSKRELNKKMGLASLEGQIYRTMDALIEENAQLIAEGKRYIKARRNAAGYNIFDIRKGKTFDLTPLLIGSQGTLGIISEATLEIVAHNPLTHLALVSLRNLNDLRTILPKIVELKPSICDMVNQTALQQVAKINPNLLNDVLDSLDAEVHLFVEFDDPKDSVQEKAIKRLGKIIDKIDGVCLVAKTPEDQERIWKIRHSVATILTHPQGQSKAVPVAEDVCIPVSGIIEFLRQAEKIYKDNDLPAAAWGHVAEGVIRMQPIFDLGQLGDRQKLFKLSDAIYTEVIKLGGSTTAASGDGRIRAPYLRQLYGDELFNLMMQVKQIFDPHDILNKGTKTASLNEVKSMLRSDYNLGHRHEHLPRS